MSRRSAVVTQADITRVVRGLIAAGVPSERITGLKMTADGVTLLMGDQTPSGAPLSLNEWDEVLK